MTRWTPKALWELAKDSVKAWNDDYAPSMGAALAYYTVFSIAPLLIIVIAVVGLFLGEEAARGEIFAQLRGLLGEEGAIAINGLVESASEPAKGTIGAIVSIAALVVGATTVFGELQSDLDRIWEAPAPEKASGLWKLLRTRLLSFGMVLGIGFLLLLSLVVSAALAAFGKFWASWFGDWTILLQAINFLVSFVTVTGLFAMIYKLLPRVDISWHDVWIGAAVTSLLFQIGKFLIGLYIGRSSVVSGFGAAGSLVVLLLWVYYAAQIFLLGAEFTWVYAYRYGSRREMRRDAQPAAQAVGEKATNVGELREEANARADNDVVPWPSPATAVFEKSRGNAVRAGSSAQRMDAFLERHPKLLLTVATLVFAAAGIASEFSHRRRARHAGRLA